MISPWMRPMPSPREAIETREEMAIGWGDDAAKGHKKLARFYDLLLRAVDDAIGPLSGYVDVRHILSLVREVHRGIASLDDRDGALEAVARSPLHAVIRYRRWEIEQRAKPEDRDVLIHFDCLSYALDLAEISLNDVASKLVASFLKEGCRKAVCILTYAQRIEPTREDWHEACADIQYLLRLADRGSS